MTFTEAFELLKFWFDMEINLEADSDEPDTEYKKVLLASQIVFEEVGKLRASNQRLISALAPFANYACDEPHVNEPKCQNCIARDAINTATN